MQSPPASPSIAVLDDYQKVALKSADWSALATKATIKTFHDPWPNEDAVALALEPFQIIALMRERTPFPASLIARLPNLRMIALTGTRTNTLDIAACTERGILISHTSGNPSTAAAELNFALILACARALPQAFGNMAAGRWEEEVPMGTPLAGKRLGVLGLGHLGKEVARMAQGFRMDVVAWSQNLTAEAAALHGCRLVSKAELFATSDVVSLNLVLSDRTRGIVGREELSSMKQGAILVNAARAGLVDQAALMDALQSRKITAGLDVFDREPLAANHALRKMPNAVLTPHLGYVVDDVFRYYYRDIIEDIEAYISGKPIRVLNPDVMR
ncbi:MAG TPA: D-2-hydroxyacid dehydrogenase family protein [Burkholderiaceae bacterium]|nr:D-2-hydroxyacid dehydrogenase family protein [Burkholderiaceae bacterium]